MTSVPNDSSAGRSGMQGRSTSEVTPARSLGGPRRMDSRGVGAGRAAEALDLSQERLDLERLRHIAVRLNLPCPERAVHAGGHDQDLHHYALLMQRARKPPA